MSRIHYPNFQSHYGAIATVATATTVPTHFLAFNPTMVRLQRLRGR
mgnify:CR=1 FL=1